MGYTHLGGWVESVGVGCGFCVVFAVQSLLVTYYGVEYLVIKVFALLPQYNDIMLLGL